MREDIEFDAEGTILRGWFYVSDERSAHAPAIVMAHGYAGIKEQLLDEYASVSMEAWTRGLGL
jgi:uncharacterized protein